MSERKFFETLVSEIMIHEFAKEKLTKEENEALERFDKAYDSEIQDLKLSDKEEGDLVGRLLDEISGAREAFNKFNIIVENLEKQASRSGKYKYN